MKKEKIIKTFIIILTIIIFLYVFSYWSSKRYDKQQEFFVNSCINTFYYDNGYYINDLIAEFVEDLPNEMANYIEKDYSGDYFGWIEAKSIEPLCENIFDFYKEAQEENKYDYCEQYRCR